MDPSTSVNLNRLLARLDQTLLSTSKPDSRLPSSQYERNKIGANLEHARTLLLTIEKQSSTVRVQTQRQQIQADLLRKRELVKRLGARLQELNQVGEEDESDDDEDEVEDEGGEVGGVASYAPARNDVDDGLDTGESPGLLASSSQSQQQPSALRSRRPLQAGDNHMAATTTARNALFSGRAQQSPPSTSNLSQNETLLTHNRTEQETLTTGLLSLASQLKQSSLQFSSSLEVEKDTLKRAEGGLDKNAQGMEAAGQKMGLLRRMSEGQGWWGRIKLYAFIFGLWVACFLVVFVGPKLRL